jgi:hypothetical protein
MFSNRRQVLTLLLCLAVIVVLGFVFRLFVMDNIVQPITLVAWAVWRVISSVNQKIYWGFVIAISLFLVIRMIPPESPNIHNQIEDDRPTAENGYSTWLSKLASAISDRNSLEELKQRLVDLYSAFVVQKDKVSPMDVEEILRSKGLPISEGGQLFFSPKKSSLRAQFYEMKLLFVTKISGIRMRQGDKMPAMLHEPIDELLNLMENHTEDEYEK